MPEDIRFANHQCSISFQFWVAYAPCGSQHKDAVQVTLEQIDLIKRFISQYPKLQFVNDSQGKALSNISTSQCLFCRSEHLTADISNSDGC